MNAADLNEFIVIADRVKVTSGFIKNVEFSINSVGDTATAKAVPVYSDLSIVELDDETGSEKGIMERLSSFIANTFVIKKNNPGDEASPEKSSVIYVHQKNEAFLEFVWIALRKAIGGVIGFS